MQEREAIKANTPVASDDVVDSQFTDVDDDSQSTLMIEDPGENSLFLRVVEDGTEFEVCKTCRVQIFDPLWFTEQVAEHRHVGDR